MPCTCMSLQQIWSSGCSRQQGAALRGAGARHSGSWLCSLTISEPHSAYLPFNSVPVFYISCAHSRRALPSSRKLCGRLCLVIPRA